MVFLSDKWDETVPSLQKWKNVQGKMSKTIRMSVVKYYDVQISKTSKWNKTFFTYRFDTVCINKLIWYLNRQSVYFK